MADTYTIVGQYPDVLVLGSGKTQDVQVIQVVTSPSGIYFETSLTRQNATSANIRNQVAGFASLYEAAAAVPGVAAVQWTQEPTRGGLLEDHVIFYVVSTSGESEGVINVSYTDFTPTRYKPRIKALVAALDATEAS